MRTFSDTLRDLRNGQADEQCAQALADLISAVRESNRPGAMTLTIKVKPVGGDATQVQVDDVIKVTKPSPSVGATVLFTTSDNSLQRRDPRQPELTGLRKVEEFPVRESAQNS